MRQTCPRGLLPKFLVEPVDPLARASGSIFWYPEHLNSPTPLDGRPEQVASIPMSSRHRNRASCHLGPGYTTRHSRDGGERDVFLWRDFGCGQAGQPGGAGQRYFKVAVCEACWFRRQCPGRRCRITVGCHRLEIKKTRQGRKTLRLWYAVVMRTALLLLLDT